MENIKINRKRENRQRKIKRIPVYKGTGKKIAVDKDRTGES